MEKEILEVSQSSIAQALAADYFCIYYVNTETDRFIEYSSSPEYRSFGLPKTGDDFISFSRKNFEELIYLEDRELFLENFTKENIVKSLDRHSHFTMSFRMLFDQGPTYVHLKVTRMIEKEKRHAVIGINNIDEEMKQQARYLQSEEDRITYSRIAQALAGDYFSIYVVDPVTDRFFQYTATKEFDTLQVEKEGEDFFNLSRKNMRRLIYPEDKDRFMAVFTKKRIMSILKRDGSFTTKYRLMFDEEPVYVSMKATLLEDHEGEHLIVGTNNIDAQMKREQEYQQKMAEARTTAKNDFLANMSHDIRTPMNAIVGYTNIANANLDNPQIIEDSLAKIGSSSHFLLSLINDILDISKIESGKMQLSIGKCNLAAIFQRIEDITVIQAKQKKLRLTYDHERIRHFHVIADELRIEQVLVNIAGNAIKYTPEGKTVDLTAIEEAGSLPGRAKYRFVIKDTGIGISEEYLPHIFESFTREENTTINRVQGTGLGLAITAKVVELMGGKISVKSKLNEGSEFTVELELEIDEPEETVSKEEQKTNDISGSHILIVEDNDINAEIAIMILQQFGLQADRAVNGSAGLEIVRENPNKYDAVLMDIQMPVMNGYEATRAIRQLKDPYFQNLPIIAMSANAFDDDVRDCLNAGMNDHIAKPFQPDELLKLLQKYL